MTGFLNQSLELVTLALAGLLSSLTVALFGLIVWRGLDEVRFLWRQRIIARYRPSVDALLSANADCEAVAPLFAAKS